MPLAKPARPMSRGRPPRSSLPHGRRAESFADDLNTRRGIVSGRVALLPRSTEIQPHVARIRPPLPHCPAGPGGFTSAPGAGPARRGCMAAFTWEHASLDSLSPLSDCIFPARQRKNQARRWTRGAWMRGYMCFDLTEPLRMRGCMGHCLFRCTTPPRHGRVAALTWEAGQGCMPALTWEHAALTSVKSVALPKIM